MPSPEPATTRRYHHGDLARALVDAGVELAREGGPQAVVVREASRRVGVSHNAAYRHFPDRDALLEAVCERCMEQLAALMEEGIRNVEPTTDAAELARRRLNATGAAYVHFAVAEPGLFSAAFSVPEHDPAEATTVKADTEAPAFPYAILSRQLDELVTAGGLTPEQREGAEMTAWSAVHGLSALLTEGPLRTLPDAEREAALQRLLLTISKGLSS